MLSLSRLLAKKEFPEEKGKAGKDAIHELQLRMLRIQQGIWHSKCRAIVVFEGFDAAGKGGSIRRLTEILDPRGLRVHPIGPPTAEEQGRHYLYRFWQDLPAPGTIAIFDRSWYGRVLVERVEGLIPEKRWREAYDEINQFEAMLTRDGIDLIKIFLAIHPQEQLRRFEARLKDPYKQWKLTDDDLKARSKWTHYVNASDELLRRTHKRNAPWHLIPADSKEHAQHEVLKIVTAHLSHHGAWIEAEAEKARKNELRTALRRLRELPKAKSASKKRSKGKISK